MGNYLWETNDWTFDKLYRTYDAIEEIGVKELNYNIYPNSLEIISSEQMLDAYTSIAMPINYNHWSFGKHFITEKKNYEKGYSGLAYEIVSNTNPCINYLMEGNTMTIQALVMAHACVSLDTEYLSPLGWRKISEYDGGLVGQYHEDGRVTFVLPKEYIKRPQKDFILFEDVKVAQCITDDHTVPFINGPGNLVKITGAELVTRHAKKTRGFNGRFIAGYELETISKLNFSDDEIRLHIAIKSDGSYAKKGNPNHFNAVSHNRVRFHLKKQRKIKRLENILNRLGIVYEKVATYGGRWSIRFNYHRINKRFTKKWYRASSAQLRLISKEVLLWDGYKKGQCFSSAYKSDVKYVQFVWSSIGLYASIRKDIRCWNVRFSRQKLAGIGKDTKFSRIDSKDGFSYCFTLDTGMWVSRYKSKISVTGNSMGHNHYFKNNYLSRQWTDAEGIVDYMLFAKNYIAECELREGEKEVELFLDSCHALKDYGVNKYIRPAKLSMMKEKERQKEREAYLQTQVSEYYKVLPLSKNKKKKIEDDEVLKSPEENILYFCEKYAPNLKPWQREILRIVRKIAQYFYPQTMTQIGNEGFASWTHYTIMNRLHEKGLTSPGSHLEFLESHAGVLWQHEMSMRINPYKFGFEILSDIERICKNPTEEDKYWFPNLPGQKPLDVIKDVVENFRDESLIRQYLSPHLIRKMKLFSLKDLKEDNKYYHITNIHDDLGYQGIREVFANQKEREVYIPRLEIYSVSKKDQTLHIRYYPYKEKKLKADPHMVRHLSRLWGDCPITIHNQDGSIIMSKTI